jgi:hypothetical protein
MRRLIVFMLAAGGLFLLGRAVYYYEFPYGYNHCCDLGLSGSLRTYAHKHDGWFPRGESCPEASLSLLYFDDHGDTDAHLLAGRTVPEELTAERLSQGKLLTPDTCDWHYVEGLRLDDDGHLALFWDKVGLGHDGQRMPPGWHTVLLVDGERYTYAAEEWPAFLAEQQKLLAEVPNRRAARAESEESTKIVKAIEHDFGGNATVCEALKKPACIYVDLRRVQITDDGLHRLAKTPRIVWLRVDGDKLTDAGLEHLKALTDLQILSIECPKITDSAVKSLKQSLPNCRIYHPKPGSPSHVDVDT